MHRRTRRLPSVVVLTALAACLVVSPATAATDIVTQGRWWYDAMGVDEVRAAGATGAGVTVAVIDSGLDWNHLDIAYENLWKNPGEVPDNGIDDDGNGYIDDVIGWNFLDNSNKPWDHDGHGTFVTGQIAATWNNGAGLAGINPRARIMVLRALNNYGLPHALRMTIGTDEANALVLENLREFMGQP